MRTQSLLRLRLAALAVVVVVTSTTPSNVAAHQDTLLLLEPDGTLSGLPRDYLPAHLRISRSALGVVPSVTVVLSGNVVDFPPCIATLFAVPAREQIRALASWYHEPRSGDRLTLPPYLVFYLPQRTEGSPWVLEGHTIMLDLRTAEIVSIERHRLTGGPGESVKPQSICSPTEMKLLKLRRTGGEATRR